MTTTAAAVTALRDAGWLFVPAAPEARTHPNAPAVSAALRSWLGAFSSLGNTDETVWFVSAGDFTSTSEPAFAWNEFERISLSEAEDADARSHIVEFWRRHTPILLSVRGGYAYLAVRADGRVVHGGEPEFEETTVVAEGLTALLEQIARGADAVHGLVRSLIFG